MHQLPQPQKNREIAIAQYARRKSRKPWCSPRLAPRPPVAGIRPCSIRLPRLTARTPRPASRETPTERMLHQRHPAPAFRRRHAPGVRMAAPPYRSLPPHRAQHLPGRLQESDAVGRNRDNRHLALRRTDPATTDLPLRQRQDMLLWPRGQECRRDWHVGDYQQGTDYRHEEIRD